MIERRWTCSLGSVGLLALLAGCGDSTTPANPDAGSVGARPPGIYVTDATSAAVLIFAPGATGNALPARTIAGPHTGLSSPFGLAVDSLGQLYVANRTGASVTVYARDARGDAPPLRTLTASGMGSPAGLALGPGDDLYVSTCPGCGAAAGGATGVFHFPAQVAQSDRELAGAGTGLTFPGAIALDGSGDLIVANASSGTVSVFAPGAAGNTAPIRSFSPGNVSVQSVAYGPGSILLGVPGVGIQIYAASASTGAQPLATLPSTALSLQYPGGLFVDAATAPPVLYLVDVFGKALRVIQTAGTAPNLSAGAVTTLGGSGTGFVSPAGVVVVR